MPSVFKVFTSKQIASDTWLICGDGCASYLLAGSGRAVMIDTGYAPENIAEYAATLIGKPVDICVNTHGHFDHTGGNGWFKRAYMSLKAMEIAKTPYPSKRDLNLPLDYPVTAVGNGDKIELGGRTLEIFEVPAHAPSSIALLDAKELIFFTGDEVAPTVMLMWQQDDPQPTVERYAANVAGLMERRADFDHICWGHGDGLHDASLMEDCLENARRILSGGAELKPLDAPSPEAEASDDGPDPRDFFMPRPECKRVSTWKRSTIIFDARYINNEKNS